VEAVPGTESCLSPHCDEVDGSVDPHFHSDSPLDFASLRSNAPHRVLSRTGCYCGPKLLCSSARQRRPLVRLWPGMSIRRPRPQWEEMGQWYSLTEPKYGEMIQAYSGRPDVSCRAQLCLAKDRRPERTVVSHSNGRFKIQGRPSRVMRGTPTPISGAVQAWDKTIGPETSSWECRQRNRLPHPDLLANIWTRAGRIRCGISAVR